VPAWVWLTAVAAALVTGLLGGLAGGAAVVAANDDGTGGVTTGYDPLPPVDSSKPLSPKNTSVAAVAARVLPSTVQVRVINGKGADATGATGSGFVVDRRGDVITNNHVVEVAESDGVIDVIDNAGHRHSAEVVGRSPTYDVAVLKVSSMKGMRPAALGSSQRMIVGETVVAIGSPLGLTSTVTSGIVSAIDRPVTTGSADSSSYINAVQTDAAINPGNSGGPLVNLRGQVVGMNSAIATTGGGIGGESGNIGVGFAIPMEQVRLTAGQIQRTGKAEYPVIGANVSTGGTSTNGATVADVPSGTPASEAGLEQGDRIVAVADKAVPDGISLIVAIRSHRPGETIKLTVVRDGDRQQLEVTLDAKTG
jgi:putative serine protease PepD